MKRIYWFAYYGTASPSVRYRGMYPLHWMNDAHDVRSRFVVPGYGFGQIMRFLAAYLSALFRPRTGCLVVIQRVRSQFLYASALKLLVWLRPAGTVYDLDDADYLEHPPSTIHWFAKHCAHVSAGSIAIQHHLRQFNPRVHFITSPVVRMGIRKRARSPVFTVGWVGDFASGHGDGLKEQLFPALDQLDFEIELVLIGVDDPQDIAWIRGRCARMSHVHVDIPMVHSWTDEQWLQERISAFDVGIATLQDTPIQRAKSGIKAKQYMNIGVPVLSTDLPENNSVVRGGVNGFLFNGADALAKWIARLNAMDDAAYGRLCDGAWSSVERFDHPYFHRALEALVERKME